MLDGSGELMATLAAASFEVWRVPGRLVQQDPHDWRICVCAAPNANGDPAYVIEAPPIPVKACFVLGRENSWMRYLVRTEWGTLRV